MFVSVQDQYRPRWEDAIRGLSPAERDFYRLCDPEPGSAPPELLIGDLEFLGASAAESAGSAAETAAFAATAAPFKVLMAAPRMDARLLRRAGAETRLYVVPESESAAGGAALRDVLSGIRAGFEKNRQLGAVRAGIQKKRKELELLNSRLSSESEAKILSLEKSHIEESEKNQNEKSLLHFLDFIQSESVSYDFLEKLFRFIWKDLKKTARVHLVGLSMTTASGKSKILFYDGHSESTTLMPALDFSAEKAAAQLATAWGRPVGRIIFWQLPEISRESYLFLELVDQPARRGRINAYFNERIAILSMYLDRWMIEKEIEVVVDRWRNTFQSFPGYTHVVDENFRIYQSNYPHPAGDFCYRVLAGRESPCESCPVLKNRNTTFVLRDDTTVKTYYSQFKFQARNYFFVIYEDITKMNQLHSQIIQTEKMSTLGRLGNHLAHELNNPLTGIKSYVQTLLSDTAAMQNLPSTAASDLNEILKATVRCQKIIKNFIDFSQKKEPSLDAVAFSEVVQNTLVLLKTALRSHRLFLDLGSDRVMANSHDLQQVLFNLIKNSCQAMADGGTLKIYQEEAGGKIAFHVEDSGPGFDEAILKNIFQPFMTTKRQGEGTGLGLYLSKKLMNNMNADLQITSSSSKGAKISLIFDRV